VLDGLGRLQTDVGLKELLRYLSDPEALIWCGLQHRGRADRALRRTAAGCLRLRDDLSVEDCFTRSHLPKVDIYHEYLFIVLFSFHLSEKRRRVETVEVDMYVGNNYVVCVHPRPLRELGRARGRFLSRDEFVCSSPANVAHAVLDAVVDEYLPIMNRLSAMVDGIEEELLEEDEDVPVSVLESLFHLKHELTALRRLAVPLRDVVGLLTRPSARLLPEETQAYYDDVRDHLLRVIDMIDTMRDYLAGSLDIYTTRQTQRINQSMQRLTAISVIFLPLTFITGIYGMNFSYMPEAEWHYGFYAVLGLCAVLATAMLFYLYRKRII
jgi:magnesium transporter